MNSSNKSWRDSLDQIDEKNTSSKSLNIKKDDKPLIAKSQFLNYKQNCKIMKESLSKNQDESAYIIYVDDSDDEPSTEKKETCNADSDFKYSDSEIRVI